MSTSVMVIDDWVTRQPRRYRDVCAVFAYGGYGMTVDQLVKAANNRGVLVSRATVFNQLPVLEYYGLVTQEKHWDDLQAGEPRRKPSTWLVNHSKVIPDQVADVREIRRLLDERDDIGAWIESQPGIKASIDAMHAREANQPAEPPF